MRVYNNCELVRGLITDALYERIPGEDGELQPLYEFAATVIEKIAPMLGLSYLADLPDAVEATPVGTPIRLVIGVEPMDDPNIGVRVLRPQRVSEAA